MRTFLLCATSLLMSAAPAIAQPAAGTDATAVGSVADTRQIREFVSAVAVPSQADRIARFQVPVCPIAIGLSDQQNREVSIRMRRVASAAGIRVGGERCAPNILVFVASDKKLFIDSLRKQRPGTVSGLSAGRIQALASSPEPAVSWQLLEVRGADGRALNAGSHESDPSVLTGVGSSRLVPQARVDFRSAVVVLDAAALAGVGTTQLADYALMRAVTNSDAARSGNLTTPTILSLFAAKARGAQAPLSVTHWDIAYLKALYGMTNMLQAGAQRGELEARMRRHLAQPVNN